MNESKKTGFAIPFALLLSLLPLSSLHADWEEGLQAYRQGEYVAALEDFKQAAEEGDQRAFGKIAGMYLYGRGVPKNYIQAYAWFNLAEAAGDREAFRFRDALAGVMSVEDVYQAEKLFAGYLERYLPEGAE